MAGGLKGAVPHSNIEMERRCTTTFRERLWRSQNPAGSASFGATRDFVLRANAEHGRKLCFPLAAGDALIMSGGRTAVSRIESVWPGFMVSGLGQHRVWPGNLGCAYVQLGHPPVRLS